MKSENVFDSSVNRIMVIGCCGAGKSTLAKKLHKRTGLELIHLDQYYWKSGWIESSPEEWTKKVAALATKPKWIIDGNYTRTMNLRLEKADMVVYLDYPTWKCLTRVIKRILRYRGTVRPDMPEGCPERFDWEFLHYVASFNIRKRQSLLKRLNTLRPEQKVMILKNDEQVKAFLKV